MQLPKPSLDKHGLVAVATGTAMLGTAAVIFLSGWIAVVAGLLAAIIELGLAIGYFILYFASAPKIVKWFDDAGAQPGRKAVSVKRLQMRSNQFTHAKLVVDRDREALLLGSPMEQDYYDSLQHAVDEPRRGKSAKKGPIHDVSVGVRGPAVGHMQELFNNHWNVAASDYKLPVAPPSPPAVAI